MNHEDPEPAMSSYVTPLVLSAAGIVCSTLAITAYHCILLRYFVGPRRTQQSNNTNTSQIKNDAGVQEDILNKIPVFSISTQTSDVTDNLDQNECSICLGQWEDGDEVRLLPSCNHAFHRPCIDAWFMDHANCPVCRLPITCDCELALPNVGGELRVLHVRGNMINIPSDHHHRHPLTHDDVSGSTSTPRFHRPRPVLLHTLSLSSHMRRKPRALIMGLKRSLSLDDQTFSYIAITIRRDQGEAYSASSSSSSTKGIITNHYSYRSR